MYNSVSLSAFTLLRNCIIFFTFCTLWCFDILQSFLAGETLPLQGWSILRDSQGLTWEQSFDRQTNQSRAPLSGLISQEAIFLCLNLARAQYQATRGQSCSLEPAEMIPIASPTLVAPPCLAFPSGTPMKAAPRLPQLLPLPPDLH